MVEIIESGIVENNPKKELILEIGPSSTPIYRRSEKIRQMIQEGACYVAIDVDEKELARVKSRNEVFKGVSADLAKLPLREASVDQMWLLNVFGDLKNLPEKTADGKVIYRLGVKRYFEEMRRVLKTGGRVHIGEVVVPRTNIDWLPEQNYEDLGFEKKVYTGEDLEVFLREHGMPHQFTGKNIPESLKSFLRQNPFFVVLTKK